MDRSYEETNKETRIYLLQADYKKALKEVNRLKTLLKELGALVD